VPDVRHQVEKEAEAEDEREALEGSVEEFQARVFVFHLQVFYFTQNVLDRGKF